MLAVQQLVVAARSGDPCVLFYFDLDQFKRINDTFGHRAGDEALQEFAAMLRANFRASDILARVGGDEFAVLAVCCEPEVERLVVERLEGRLDAFNDRAGSWTLAASCGLGHGGGSSGKALAQLVAEADAQLLARRHTRSKGGLAARA